MILDQLYSSQQARYDASAAKIAETKARLSIGTISQEAADDLIVFHRNVLSRPQFGYISPDTFAALVAERDDYVLFGRSERAEMCNAIIDAWREAHGWPVEDRQPIAAHYAESKEVF